MEFMKRKQHIHKDDILFTKDTHLPYIHTICSNPHCRLNKIVWTICDSRVIYIVSRETTKQWYGWLWAVYVICS